MIDRTNSRRVGCLGLWDAEFFGAFLRRTYEEMNLGRIAPIVVRSPKPDSNLFGTNRFTLFGYCDPRAILELRPRGVPVKERIAVFSERNSTIWRHFDAELPMR